jgi:glycosyltransferase involved in cell wall biosynthesis
MSEESPSPLRFPGRLAIQQRLLPAYRLPFFDALAAACEGGLSVFAGQPGTGESVVTSTELRVAQYSPARNWHFGRVDAPYYLCRQGGLRNWLEGWQPDALIVEANPRYLSTPQAVRWMHARQRPVLGWGLGIAVAEGGGMLAALRGSRRVRFLRQFDGLIAYSQRGADQYCALGFPRERVFVALNAAAPRPGTPSPERPPLFIGRPTVLFVGRLQPRKRVDNLISACAALPNELQPLLLVVGDGPARPALQELASQVYPLTEFPGAIHGPDLAPYFARADLFVLPGTGGLAVQEAMASSLPVVVAEGDGTQDDLVRPGNGWRIPPGDEAALAEILRQALSDPARLRRMGDESYRIVREEANLEKMVEVFVLALQSVKPEAPQD